MSVSNNSIFNSVVRELYCPGIDLSQVRKFNIYKAKRVDLTGIEGKYKLFTVTLNT